MSMNIELAPELEQRLREEASRRGLAAEEYVERLLEATVTRPADSILAIFEDGWTQVSEADWHQLPSDLSENLDHYLYGASRRNL